MTRSEIFELISKIDDPVKDHASLLSNLHYTHFFLMDRYKKVLATYDLTAPQSNVLGIITHHAPKAVSLEEIKEMVLEPGSDVSRTVARLMEKGYVEKITNKDNRRKVSILATAKGLKTIRKIESDGKFETFVKGISRSEARTFVKVLLKLRENQ
ncbi:MAG: MarR family winged helix-turn-helix transcriptional regulator [Bacteroidia bacterium]